MKPDAFVALHVWNRRRALRLAARYVAACARVSVRTLREVECGRRHPSPTLIRRLSRALDTDARLLLDLCMDAEVAAVRRKWR